MLKNQCVALLLSILVATSANGADINIAYIGAADSEAYRGVLRGLDEANAQGEFLGLSYQLLDGDSATAAPRAVVAAVSAAQLPRLAQQFEGIPVFNLTASDSFLREYCDDNVFHIGPSTAMLDDATAQWRRANPRSQARAQTWHRSFRKYAAAQLNMRYYEQFKRDMNDAAWSGWAAVKLLADTIARNPALSGAALLQELKTNLAFDGQKGIDMSFRETGQLRQPLLLVENDKIVGEAPVRGVVSTTDLDSLGLIFCPK